MKLIEKINADIIAAYKARTAEGNEAKALLGVLKGAATKVNKIPEDAEVIAEVKKMIKTHNKSVAEHNVPTLTEGELAILNGYLPSQMDEATLTSVVSEFIVSEGLSGPKDMGRIMGHLKGAYGGQYDGKMASNVVKSTLASLL